MDVYGQVGIVARPPPPDEIQGRARHAEVLCLRTSDGLVPIAGRDVRLNQAFPNPAPGDIALVGYGSNFVKLGIDGRISIVTTKDGTPNGAMMQIHMIQLGAIGAPGSFNLMDDPGLPGLLKGQFTVTISRHDAGADQQPLT